jgi:hypothetical protein
MHTREFSLKTSQVSTQEKVLVIFRKGEWSPGIFIKAMHTVLFRFYWTEISRKLHRKTQNHHTTLTNMIMGEETYRRGIGPKNTNKHHISQKAPRTSPSHLWRNRERHNRCSRPSTSASCSRFRRCHLHQPLVHLQGRVPHSPWQAS